jgi:lactate dehydrogenase-like 2-hydroxyacid dehydrogenase
MRNEKLGFIGLGYLGSRIARRLIAAGFPSLCINPITRTLRLPVPTWLRVFCIRRCSTKARMLGR